VLVGKLAIARRFRNLRAGLIDKVENSLVVTGLARQVPAGDDDTRAAMSFALVIERELNFGADLKRPFGEKADSLRRPLDVLLNEIDGVGKTNRYAHFLASPCFVLDRHN
jgi:hypothetical protein